MGQPNENYQFNVLVVDDDAVILGLLKEVLSLVPGCQVFTASNPADAMRYFVQGAIDIVFTDVHMPGHTGLEMLKDISNLQKSMEVIVMTAFPSGDLAQEAMELGATSLISKPFEDITLVEVELEKAIKRILRQRSVKQELEKNPPPPSAAPKHVDNDPPMKVSIPVPERKTAPAPAPAAPAMSPVPSSMIPPKENLPVLPRKIHKAEFLDALIEVEMARYDRYRRPFIVGFIDLPENFEIVGAELQKEFRERQMSALENCVRRSDVLLDCGKDGVALVGFECNRVGADVVEHKLGTNGFFFSGFSVYPQDGFFGPELIRNARKKLTNKRKLQVCVFETEEFFGRIVQNMLADPKYNVSWVRSTDETYQFINSTAENLRLLVLSLSRDPAQWQLLIRLKKEGLIQWPILLFIDIPLTSALKNQLRQLGVRAVINKGVSQDEFLYIVQSFVVPKPQMEERKNYRALVTVPTIYRYGEKEISSNSFTLSKDGVFIRDLSPPPNGTLVNLKMLIPGMKDPITCRAEVLYVVPYFVGVSRIHVAGFACKFIDLAPENKSAVEKFVGDCLTSYLI